MIQRPRPNRAVRPRTTRRRLQGRDESRRKWRPIRCVTRQVSASSDSRGEALLGSISAGRAPIAGTPRHSPARRPSSAGHGLFGRCHRSVAGMSGRAPRRSRPCSGPHHKAGRAPLFGRLVSSLLATIVYPFACCYSPCLSCIGSYCLRAQGCCKRWCRKTGGFCPPRNLRQLVAGWAIRSVNCRLRRVRCSRRSSTCACRGRLPPARELPAGKEPDSGRHAAGNAGVHMQPDRLTDQGCGG